MRFIFPSIALGSVLIIGLSGSTLLAQDQSQPAAGASAPAASSQAPSSDTPRHKAMNPNRAAKRMAKKLGLTPDQESKIEPILADREQRIQSVNADTTLASGDRQAKMQGIYQDSDSKIEAILNDTQKQQYEQMKQTREAKRQQQGAPSEN